ncbi:HAD family hydrolase [Acetobacteroides hydrogenigenes]|uniref:HAD superfamily hydrolase (TIGR01509 family)/HAD superfamily hydrolase (TIGR01549 family) n=1 Tax=Acetobacteroides hydrogenigenes TaxID=979970 RepID=A0A4R2EWW5_9BACT|nr:HAD family phosphatase [Acetobacteroides hydrogenigenes]TCN73188.1 HAD superfamily hydrolase (TIGR01509 family)/HAD superfamily hydrolase (TIGR01549 family) [Acetobacteroides hydrogenigenes]
MKYKAVVFDMDGVLIDSEPLHKQIEQEMLKELGVNLPHEEHIKFAGVGKEMWTILKEQYGYNRDISEEELHVEKRKRYLGQLTSRPIKPIEGVVELVKIAKKAGLKLAVASSSSTENINIVTKAIGIFTDMDIIVSGDDMPRTKPYPDIFIKTAELLKLHTNECLVIEDSSNGVKAAKMAGMYCVAFRNPNSGNQNLSLADKIVNNIQEIPELLA